MNLFLTSVSSIAENFKSGYFIADFIVSVIFVLLISGFFAFEMKNILSYIVFGSLDLLFILAFILNLPTLKYISLMLIIVAIIICIFIDSSIIRKYLEKTKKSSKKVEQNGNYDTKKLIENIVTAVDFLSKNRIGALITFEKDTPLNEYMKNGTEINCPVTPEIIETIFYEGTRLHDGAIIIRQDVIVAAAVFFPSTKKEIVGKFGSRHRAALGISEVTDSLTIVVSEETGRISIASAGALTNVKMSEFEKIFSDKIS